MNFRVGQKVLCVNDKYGTYCAYPLKKGSVYTIHGFYKCPCGSQQVTLMEITGIINMGCRCDRTSTRRQSYFNWRFIPLEYFENLISISSHKEEMLEKVETQDIDREKEVPEQTSMVRNKTQLFAI